MEKKVIREKTAVLLIMSMLLQLLVGVAPVVAEDAGTGITAKVAAGDALHIYEEAMEEETGIVTSSKAELTEEDGKEADAEIERVEEIDENSKENITEDITEKPAEDPTDGTGEEERVEEEGLFGAMGLFGLEPLSEEEPVTGTISSSGTYILGEYTGSITIKSSAVSVTIKGNENEHTGTHIVVEDGRTEPLTLTIENLNITAPDWYPGIDFPSCENDEHVHTYELNLRGQSKITGVKSAPGIHVPKDASLTIKSTSEPEGTLEVTGGTFSAGIGGGYEAGGGEITISGGTITATGGISGAGIGSGGGGTGGPIIIKNNPTVVAISPYGVDIRSDTEGAITVLKRNDSDGPDLTYIRLNVENLSSDTENKVSLSGQEHKINNSGMTGFFVERSAAASTDIKLHVAENEYSGISFTPGDVQNFCQTINESVTIQYDAGTGGTVSRASETMGSITGDPQGAIAIADSGYRFVNWTKGEEEVSNSPEFVPQKTGLMYVPDTYTANFQVKPKITVNAKSDSKVYDGTPLTLTNTDYECTGSLAEGDSLVVTVSGSITDVGTATSTIGVVTVQHGSEDVSENYVITTQNGTLTVTQRPLQITAASDSETYDGTLLTNAGYSITNGGLAPGRTWLQ